MVSAKRTLKRQMRKNPPFMTRGNTSEYDEKLTIAKVSAAAIGVEIPPFSNKTSDRLTDAAAINRYLFIDVQNPIEARIRAKYPEDHEALFKLAVRLNFLADWYWLFIDPRADASVAENLKMIIGFIKWAGPTAGLPSRLWKPVVNKVEAKA